MSGSYGQEFDVLFFSGTQCSVVIVLIIVICLAVVQYISKSYDMIYDMT